MSAYVVLKTDDNALFLLQPTMAAEDLQLVEVVAEGEEEEVVEDFDDSRNFYLHTRNMLSLFNC